MMLTTNISLLLSKDIPTKQPSFCYTFSFFSFRLNVLKHIFDHPPMQYLYIYIVPSTSCYHASSLSQSTEARKCITMTICHRTVIFIGILTLISTQITSGSVVSTGDFNKDFFVTWSPSHVNTSADGKTRSLKLDQESGMFKLEKTL